jgi:hypothetical protein
MIDYLRANAVIVRGIPYHSLADHDNHGEPHIHSEAQTRYQAPPSATTETTEGEKL